MGIFKRRRGDTAALEAEALVRRIERAVSSGKTGAVTDEARAELRECLAEAESRLGDGHRATQLALHHLSVGLLLHTSLVAEAEAGFRRLRKVRGQALTDRATPFLLRLHAVSLSRLGRHEEAAREYEAVGDQLGDHVDELSSAWLGVRALRSAELCHLRRFAEAEADARAIIERSVFTRAPTGLFVRWIATHALSHALTRQGRPEEAESLARKALAAMRVRQDGRGDLVFSLEQSLVHALSAQGRHAEALDCVTSARQAYNPPLHFDAAEVHTAGVPTAEALLGLGRHDEAAQAARDTITALTELFSPDHACVRDARELLERATSPTAR
ncbi:tetratricopeptide repeat protein [Streptomyces sp. NPDC008092]|uniref:tetratricopeptide repeat protein n=1 Tax=Streptomyces sp. NPDC008092 TaxID=3364808 RepID=UPI0036E36FD2